MSHRQTPLPKVALLSILLLSVSSSTAWIYAKTLTLRCTITNPNSSNFLAISVIKEDMVDDDRDGYRQINEDTQVSATSSSLSSSLSLSSSSSESTEDASTVPDKEDPQWGASYIGGDPCGSKYNGDPFDKKVTKPGLPDDMKARIQALSDEIIRRDAQKWERAYGKAEISTFLNKSFAHCAYSSRLQAKGLTSMIRNLISFVKSLALSPRY